MLKMCTESLILVFQILRHRLAIKVSQSNRRKTSAANNKMDSDDENLSPYDFNNSYQDPFSQYAKVISLGFC